MESVCKAMLAEAALVGAASLVVGSVSLGTACIVGGTYALVDVVTAPFFKQMEEKGDLAKIGGSLFSFLANTILTTSLVNQLAGLSLKVSKVAYISFLPLMALGKILAIGAILVGGYAAISALGDRASRETDEGVAQG